MWSRAYILATTLPCSLPVAALAVALLCGIGLGGMSIGRICCGGVSSVLYAIRAPVEEPRVGVDGTGRPLARSFKGRGGSPLPTDMPSFFAPGELDAAVTPRLCDRKRGSAGRILPDLAVTLSSCPKASSSGSSSNSSALSAFLLAFALRARFVASMTPRTSFWISCTTLSLYA